MTYYQKQRRNEKWSQQSKVDYRPSMTQDPQIVTRRSSGHPYVSYVGAGGGVNGVFLEGKDYRESWRLTLLLGQADLQGWRSLLQVLGGLSSVWISRTIPCQPIWSAIPCSERYKL